ncbi:MAG: hypothetical protein HYY04_09685, partial [Chloroflexi bacterium]|nr:hypothetical protein [Chloroflexota bacterium]
MTVPDARLTPPAIRAHSLGPTIGRQIVCFREIGSTNHWLREAARRGAAEGLAALAEYQRAGRGQRSRRWVAPPGSSILCSVLLRPPILARDIFLLTMLAGVAVVDALTPWPPLPRCGGGAAPSPPDPLSHPGERG